MSLVPLWMWRCGVGTGDRGTLLHEAQDVMCTQLNHVRQRRKPGGDRGGLSYFCCAAVPVVHSLENVCHSAHLNWTSSTRSMIGMLVSSCALRQVAAFLKRAGGPVGRGRAHRAIAIERALRLARLRG